MYIVYPSAKLILAYFSIDDSLMRIKRYDFVNLGQDEEIIVGQTYRVKERSRIYDGTIVEIGKSNANFYSTCIYIYYIVTI